MAKSKASTAGKSGKKTGASGNGVNTTLAALDGTTVAVMTIDRDLVITYANRATHELLRKYEAEFRAAFPAFRAENIIGTCIDIFHKKPEYQRGILADPNRMPHQADIHVGRLTFQITVTAIRNANGTHIGNGLSGSTSRRSVRARPRSRGCSLPCPTSRRRS